MTRLTLTTRLAEEVCKRHNARFPDAHTLRRRLRKLERAGLLSRVWMLSTGEHIFHLTRDGSAFVERELGIEVPRRACYPIKPLLQSHEIDLSRYWIKFMDDCQKIGLPILDFYRDGQFVSRQKLSKLIPDGLIILRIRGKARAFFLEMDRSTQTSGAAGGEQAIFRKKLEHYRVLRRSFRRHDIFRGHQVVSLRLIIVCQNEKRLQSLRSLAHDMGMGKFCAFTCWQRLIVVKNPHKANGWDYLSANLLAAPLFSFSNTSARSPPMSLLIR